MSHWADEFNSLVSNDGTGPFPLHNVDPAKVRFATPKDADKGCAPCENWPMFFWQENWYPVPTEREMLDWQNEGGAVSPDEEYVDPDCPDSWENLLS